MQAIAQGGELIRATLVETWRYFESELNRVRPDAFTESVFRHFFIRSLPADGSAVHYETEWAERVDLVVTTATAFHAIEFKFYVYRHAYGPEGNRLRRKGGPGSKNASEFKACLAKLSSFPDSDLFDVSRPRRELRKYGILVYEYLDEDTGRRSFHETYCDASFPSLVPQGCACLHTESLPPIELPQAGHQFHCKWMEVK
jgi:hypothetical protein